MDVNHNGEEASKDEQIGFHKGALKTLAAERQELNKILQIVEQLMHMHINSLKELGVDLEAQASAQGGDNNPQQSSQASSEPIENIVNK